MSPRVMQVIEVNERRGAGIPGDPVRYVPCYYSLDGTLLAEYDEWERSKLTRCTVAACEALVFSGRCLAGHEVSVSAGAAREGASPK